MGVRRVVLRTSLVLDKNSGALPRLLLQYNLFAGGPMGSGDQWWPWIHIEDEVGAIYHLLVHETAQGAFNLSSPNPVRMKDFGKTLAGVLGRPYWFPIPAFAMELAFGEMSTVLLTGQRAVPANLEKAGYSFRFNQLQPALRDVLK